MIFKSMLSAFGSSLLGIRSERFHETSVVDFISDTEAITRSLDTF